MPTPTTKLCPVRDAAKASQSNRLAHTLLFIFSSLICGGIFAFFAWIPLYMNLLSADQTSLPFRLIRHLSQDIFLREYIIPGWFVLTHCFMPELKSLLSSLYPSNSPLAHLRLTARLTGGNLAGGRGEAYGIWERENGGKRERVAGAGVGSAGDERRRSIDGSRSLNEPARHPGRRGACGAALIRDPQTDEKNGFRFWPPQRGPRPPGMTYVWGLLSPSFAMSFRAKVRFRFSE